jgi:hypothetical protein
MWNGEALFGLGIQGVGILILLGVFFLPSVAPDLSKIFDLWKSCCLLLPSRHCLGSSTNIWVQTPYAPVVMTRGLEDLLYSLWEREGKVMGQGKMGEEKREDRKKRKGRKPREDASAATKSPN